MATEAVARPQGAEEAPNAAPLARPSPFFFTPARTSPNALAMLQLKKDSSLPVTLRTDADDGYAEGAVTNTRFGSFPHSTLMGLEWGSQVRASKVDTGTRGRKGKQPAKKQNDQQPGSNSGGGDVRTGEKRKSNDMPANEEAAPLKKLKQQHPDSSPAKAPIEAGSGFVHILPPTPESWTMSLDHRTQVVYIPDYSYILHRLKVRPGNTIIEAGAGSGSFTHAAARAVFSGYPNDSNAHKIGRVFSYEYHAPRVQTLRDELDAHNLTPLVHLTHRDVYNDGFSKPNAPANAPLKANGIFLDLPAPWTALKHLDRNSPDSPLDPNAPVHLCTFSPCIEQVTATVSFLRRAGWTAIEMVEVQNRRLDVRRERVGLGEQGLRNAIAAHASVEEAIGRLREVEADLSDFHRQAPPNKVKKQAAGAEQVAGADQSKGPEQAVGQKPVDTATTDANTVPMDESATPKPATAPKPLSKKQQRLSRIKADAETRQLFKEGRLTMRTESEAKTHTSYLVFAVLPQVWGEAEEKAAREKWGGA